MYPPSSNGDARQRLPRPTIVVTCVLTLVAVLVGQREWAVPERVLGGWQVADVPTSLTALLVGGTALCLLLGTVTTLRDAALRPRHLAFQVWMAVSLLAAAALIWNALVMAADAEVEIGPIIPIFHWLFTFVPALLAGSVARGRGPGPARATALGTGVVTLPLFALGWSLLASRESIGSGIADSLWNSVILGVGPLLAAAVIARALAQNRERFSS